MLTRLLVLLLAAALLAPLTGCGSDSSSGTGSTAGGAQSTSALLNEWSDTTLAALAALQARATAATKRDKAAYDKATADLKAAVEKIEQFPTEAKQVTGTSARAITADAAAWKAWADALSSKDLSGADAPRVGRLGAAAAKAHLAAYKAAGVEVPADFQKQAAGA